ncbi:MAG: SAM-dependent methyltransferase [Alphaproteobacteria bacterium]|nr:SAM-dependent methyltransferase [Alphaproteobacteria bacterium]
MSGFSAAWLALRAPYDDRARDAGLIARLAAWCRSLGRPVALVDLGAGTGGLFRGLAPSLAADQRWRLYDADAGLQAQVADANADWATAAGHRIRGDEIRLKPSGHCARVRCVAKDLSAGIDPAWLEDVDVVTASALFDLVSRAWVDQVTAACAQARVAVYAALSFDGRMAWQPADPDDADLAELFAAHQTRDKGFGGALGPEGGAALADALSAHGYEVREASSDWELGPDARALQREVLDGWAAATLELPSVDPRQITEWAARRRALIAAGGSRLTVGHVDVLGLPAQD